VLRVVHHLDCVVEGTVSVSARMFGSATRRKVSDSRRVGGDFEVVAVGPWFLARVARKLTCSDLNLQQGSGGLVSQRVHELLGGFLRNSNPLERLLKVAAMLI
jgi:hypothetical protein